VSCLKILVEFSAENATTNYIIYID